MRGISFWPSVVDWHSEFIPVEVFNYFFISLKLTSQRRRWLPSLVG